jgi:transcriptional regulator with XRE-family HTH domain
MTTPPESQIALLAPYIVSECANIISVPAGDRVAGELIREIRRESGLRQAELARRAALPRSVVNAYEHGRRQPGVDAVARLAAAAGLELRIGPSTAPVDPMRASRILGQVLDLAEALPSRRRGVLAYPSLGRFA